MYDEQRDKAPSPFGCILSGLWKVEKTTWRWAAALGVLGAVLVAVINGFFGYASYGYPGMVAGPVLGAIVGWIIATLILYLLLSTASFSTRRPSSSKLLKFYQRQAWPLAAL